MTFKTYASNNNNDLFMDGSNNIAIKEDQDAVGQSCEQAVRARKEEMQLAVNDGVPYFDVFFGGVPDKNRMDYYITLEIQKVPNVISILDFVSSISNGIYSYVTTIETAYGSVYVKGGIQ